VEWLKRLVCACWGLAIANFAGLAGFATAEHDLVIIGGGVAGYVAAIKAGQEGLKVR
jgi:NADPH-dependent 2,4-dienoyl-CoA reductase/sulfur reductase-like enzyme